ncbi:hypothetical protein CcaCcLH18_02807 [Colletotrichum camelliae]|nr:hypothetical protein CcaCcLH18_02807 [Colletotrichum camelliae]
MTDTIIADLTPLHDRMKYVSMVMIFFTLGSFLGPIIGGAIVDNTTWRWVFYINLPICAAALPLVFLVLRVNHKREGTIAQRLGRVDYSGNFILVCAVVSILIPLTWGGTTYSWKSWHILFPLVVGFAGLVFFGIHQGKLAREPTMPLRVYSNLPCALGYGITFLHGIVLSWLSFFLPVYFQILLESTPLQSGVKLLAVVIPLAPAGMAGGIAIAVTGHYKMVIVAGFVLLSIAVGCMTTLDANSSTALWIVFQVLAGLGGGLSLTATPPAVQAPVPESDVAIATAAWAFARSFGAIWGAAIPSAVFNSRFDELLHLIPEPSVRDLLAHGGADQIIHVSTGALKRVWIVLIPFAVVPIGLALWTEEIWVAKKLGGLLGWGVMSEIADTYRFICDNYNPGDEIVILGFSRGAFVARSVAGMVCSLGLLNRFGLANFGAIFSDYQNFSEWDESTDFNPDIHLTGFNIHNSDQLTHEAQSTMDQSGVLILEGRDNIKMEEDLRTEKEAIFYELTGRDCDKRVVGYELKSVKKTPNKVEKADKKEFRMLLCDKKNRNDPDELWQPVEPEITALGVWDTVGSLGFPKMPFGLDKITPGRSAQELRFASFEVHSKIRNAFHALALDEWRTSFAPTLWTKTKDNKTTNLRQVWFPGGHSDVGGGVKDNQIATISLAWMADQLTAVGVEFTASEMLRIFRTINLDLEPRPWALGRTSSPGYTGLPDRAWNFSVKPGLYKEEEKAAGKALEKDSDVLGHELVHPSVRIRYQYGGKEMNDKGMWECRALTKNGYVLDRLPEARPKHLKSQTLTYKIAFDTLAGTISSVQGDKGDIIGGLNEKERHIVVPRQLPFEKDLYSPRDNEDFNWVEEKDLYNDKGATPKAWVWKSDKVTLHEERIGNWERLYLVVNQEHLERAEARKSSDPGKTGAADGGLSSWRPSFWPFSGSTGPQPTRDERPYGYWEFITWQQGDTRPRQASKHVTKSIDKNGNISYSAVLAQ